MIMTPKNKFGFKCCEAKVVLILSIARTLGGGILGVREPICHGTRLCYRLDLLKETFRKDIIMRTNILVEDVKGHRL